MTLEPNPNKHAPINVAIIPARGGSKRIPRKNIRPFFGKPIIAYSVETAINSHCFDRVIVSTDDKEIAGIAREYGAEVPFLRPDALADDHSITVDVIKHAIEYLENTGAALKFVCCIYPTAPFLLEPYLIRGLEIIEQSGAQYAFSATEYRFPIQRALRKNINGSVKMFDPKNFATRSQDLETAYHDAGQFYWGTPEAFKKKLPFFDDYSQVVLLPSFLVQDLDTEADWLNAELMYKVLQYKKQANEHTIAPLLTEVVEDTEEA